MISFIEGKIEHLGDKYAIINAGGIGYRLIVSPKLSSSISKSQPDVNPVRSSLAEVQRTRAGSASETSNGTSPELVRAFVYSKLNMREGTFDMYGFADQKDLDLFTMLTSVSGIGPRGAMNVMSTVEPQHLKAAVVKGDAGYLKKISGLGPKIAQRLVLELKNKIEGLDLGDGHSINIGQQGEALDALLALGYNHTQALEALQEIGQGKKLQEQVREALRLLGKK